MARADGGHMRPQDFYLPATRTQGLLLPSSAPGERLRGLLTLPADMSLSATVVHWTQETSGEIAFPVNPLHPVLAQGLAAVLVEHLPARAAELPKAPPSWGWLEHNLLFLEDGMVIARSVTEGRYKGHTLPRSDARTPEPDAWAELNAAALGERETRYSPALAFWDAITAWTATQERNGQSERHRIALDYVGQAMYRTVPL